MTQFIKMFRAKYIVGLLLVVVTMGLASCTSNAPEETGDIDMSKLTLAPVSELPAEVLDTKPEVQEAYRFAMANPELLKKIPCYCGCNTVGHMNNLECYVTPSGEYELHAAY